MRRATSIACFAVILFFVTLPNQFCYSYQLIRVLEQEAEFDKNYNGTTSGSSELTVYKYSVKEHEVVRVRVQSSNANRSTPLLAVVREPTTIISMQLPILIENYMYNLTARTLCPFSVGSFNSSRNVTISLELSSFQPVHYSFIATTLNNFILHDDKPLDVSASASEPVFFQYDFPENTDSVVVYIDSNDTICMSVSIQKAECPIFDQDNNILAGLMHQTVRKSAAIAVEKRGDELKSFFVIFSIRPNDEECSDMKEIIPAVPRYTRPRTKKFTLNIKAAPSKMDYVLPMTLTLGGILFVYLFAITFMITMGMYEKKILVDEGIRLLCPAAEVSVSEQRDDDDIGLLPEASTSQQLAVRILEDIEETASIASYDTLPDWREKLVTRQKLKLTVADLSLKTWRQRNSKYNRYVVSLSTLALFYVLPVVQLVLVWQDTLRNSGNQDLCWYNFRCARPFFIFVAFNNFFSNIGYVSLGLLLLILVKEREIRMRGVWRSVRAQLPPDAPDFRNEYGLPQHNGLMYALGVAVVMEGVLSASYHICPSASNYQFDTSFMYITGQLGMLKIYQLRHPDINANAHVAFALTAVFIFFAMLGVYLSSVMLWALFASSYVVIMAGVSVHFYYKGTWRFHPAENLRWIQYAWHSSKRLSCIVPVYKSRFLFLVLANGINLGVVAAGVAIRPRDFPSFLLFPFIANLCLYLTYYIFMKLVNREKLRARAIGFLCMSVFCWMSAAYFFLRNVSNWSVTAAESREYNQDCVLWKFYDNHDVWHFLSSIAIFTSFALLNCIDDDLMWVPRNRIAVF